jgi:hypothetical protein
MRARLLNLPKLNQPECQPSSSIAMSTSPNMPDLNLLDVRGMTANAMLLKLEESFPPTNPTPEDSMEKIMYRSGQRSVVEWVIQYMEEN